MNPLFCRAAGNRTRPICTPCICTADILRPAYAKAPTRQARLALLFPRNIELLKLGQEFFVIQKP